MSPNTSFRSGIASDRLSNPSRSLTSPHTTNDTASIYLKIIAIFRTGKQMDFSYFLINQKGFYSEKKCLLPPTLRYWESEGNTQPLNGY